MNHTESLHAPPEAGNASSPCCGRTLDELPRYDRITLNVDLVTCGRLSAADVMMLSGQPVVTDPNHEQAVYTMAATVCTLAGGTIELATAHEKVHAAIREIVPHDRPLAAWSAALMVDVTARAQQLARS